MYYGIIKIMLKIRLYRRGRKKAACFDVTVAEARKRTIVEKVGYYNPRLKTDNKVDKFTLKMDRIEYWQSQGAQLTDLLAEIVKRKKEN